MIQLIDTNFHQHACTIADRTKGMKVFHLTNLSFVDSGLSCDTFNIIHIYRGSALCSEELSQAVNHFKKRERDFCIWINAENLNRNVDRYLTALSLHRQNEEKGMVLDLEAYRPVSKEADKHIHLVCNRDQLSAYAQVIAENWTPLDQNVLKYYEMTASHYLEPSNGIVLCTYEKNDRMVATVELFPTNDEVMGLYGLATLEAYRGKGIGSALMRFALNKAKVLGYSQVVLQASEAGIEIYKRYGFEEQTAYFEYA
ncbi:GNAT family N-acetyltransferase [Spongiimicrobium sp. 2-473A-2-J]|uniref:GNAT family N-acetyltransferase n=1 Tax=Eudoraea algarum TaxID=3417568 RepID=UPI003D36175B